MVLKRYEEGRALYLLKQEKKLRYPFAGEPAYLISQKWFNKYKDYCLWQVVEHDFNNNQQGEKDLTTEQLVGKIIRT